jgi:hypothetical protein
LLHCKKFAANQAAMAKTTSLSGSRVEIAPPYARIASKKQ